jgi:hypothetical protein
LKSDWQIDHFVPKSVHPQGARDYDNLVYACSSCNHTKAAHLAPDPCRVAYGSCVEVTADGGIRSKNEYGITLIEALGLDAEDYRQFRIAISELLEETQPEGKVYKRFFGYPENLPDLRQEPKPPGGNRRPEGVSKSYFELRRKGSLAAVY